MDETLPENEEQEDEEVMTAQAVLKIIQEAWKNEKLSPELLPHKAEFIEVMLEQVDQMKTNVSHLDPTDLRSLIHRQELERIQYYIRSYLRTRLQKIETYPLWLAKNPGVLSAEEIKYMQDFITDIVEPLKDICERMPEKVGVLNVRQLDIAPNFESYIFVKSKETLSDAIIIRDGNSEEEIVVNRGSQFILPYSAVREQVRNSGMNLM